jgi:DNA topoisomerase-1
VRELPTKWIDFLTNTGNGERTKLEKRSGWRTRGVPRELVELAGKKFEPTNKARRARRPSCSASSSTRKTRPKTPTPRPGEEPTTLPGHLDKCPKFTVRSIEKKRTTSKPPAPFITSTLQQAASSRLELRRAEDDACRPDAVRGRLHHLHAYRLDEPVGRGVEHGSLVHRQEFGAKYVPEKPNFYSSSNKSAQEAHEAIRPTERVLAPRTRTPSSGPEIPSCIQLIWNRFVACQMPPASSIRPRHDRRADQGGDASSAPPAEARFDGFMAGAAWQRRSAAAGVAEGKTVSPIEIKPTQHFTQPRAALPRRRW